MLLGTPMHQTLGRHGNPVYEVERLNHELFSQWRMPEEPNILGRAYNRGFGLVQQSISVSTWT